jgi:hypothetical protein
MPKPIDADLARQAIYALLDCLDGQQGYDIEYMTGLSITRCDEITALCGLLLKEYGADWLNAPRT